MAVFVTVAHALRHEDPALTYFRDLSKYEYLPEFARLDTRNVGWLDIKHEFDRGEPSIHDLDLLWEFCKISFAQTRGVHCCNICKNEEVLVCEDRELKLLLGTAEIRVLSKNGVIYSSPTLIFHYVLVHKYRPPNEFMDALRAGLSPPNEKYFDRVNELGLEWNETSIAETINGKAIFRKLLE